jgi:hypothetical protein
VEKTVLIGAGWNMMEEMNIPARVGNQIDVFQAVSTDCTARTVVPEYGTICFVQASVTPPQEMKRDVKQSYKKINFSGVEIFIKSYRHNNMIVLHVKTSLRLSRPLNLIQLRRYHDANLTVLTWMCSGDVLKTRTL